MDVQTQKILKPKKFESIVTATDTARCHSKPDLEDSGQICVNMTEMNALY